MEELKVHIQENGLTKRSVASILMGSLHDPLQLMAPFVNNIKLFYRDLCRMQTTWDQKVPEKIEERIFEALSFFFKMEKNSVP